MRPRGLLRAVTRAHRQKILILSVIAGVLVAAMAVILITNH